MQNILCHFLEYDITQSVYTVSHLLSHDLCQLYVVG